MWRKDHPAGFFFFFSLILQLDEQSEKINGWVSIKKTNRGDEKIVHMERANMGVQRWLGWGRPSFLSDRGRRLLSLLLFPSYVCVGEGVCWSVSGCNVLVGAKLPFPQPLFFFLFAPRMSG